jgi:uncharacterized membrane protein YphA (DoxX/SURF4 family)
VPDILLDGIGGTFVAIAAMRFALGSFFVLSGAHKLTNKERHQAFVETLTVLGIPHIGILLLYFIAAGAGPVSVDRLLKLWIG